MGSESKDPARRPWLVGGLVVACAALVPSTLSPQARAGREGIVAGRYIVVLHDGVPEPDVSAVRLARRHRLRLRHLYRRALKGFAADVPEAEVRRLRSDPDVWFVEPDRRVRAAGQVLPSGVDRVDADRSLVAKIDGVDERVDVDVAILDTGIDLDHPDLLVVASTDCSSGDGCRDGGGNDGHGHGSHVAGIVGALDNGVGVVGVAPGARLWAVRVLDDAGSGLLSGVIDGIDWVTARAGSIEVANLSLAWRGYSAAAHAAVRSSVAAGVVYVVAAGNESVDLYGADGVFGTEDDASPAALPEVAAISAYADTDGKPGGAAGASDDVTASFTNFSRSVVPENPVQSPGAAIDLMCPGVSIRSTYRNAGYAVMSGTSMASPHAAGLAALYAAEHGRAADAAGVHAIRQALIERGRGQTSAEGLVLPNDEDANLEPLGWAVDASPGTDPAASHVADLDGTSRRAAWWLAWRSDVTVAVRDQGNEPVPEAVVRAAWSDGSADSCVTDAAGTCTLVGFRVWWSDSTTLTVTGVSHGSLSYDASANGDPDGDSDGTTITLSRP